MKTRNFELNKIILAAAALCGLEVKHLSEYFDAASILHPSCASMRRVEPKLFPFIKATGSAELNLQIALANGRSNGTCVALDEQHSCSQRAGKRAPFCSTVFVNDHMGKVLTLSHASAKEAKDLGVKCLAKASRVLGLQSMAASLNHIDMIIVDGCASSEKDLDEHVRINRQHDKVCLNKDLWHKAKNIGKAWIKLTTKRGTDRKLLYSNLSCVPIRTIKTHLTYCAKKCTGNVDEFEALWLDRIDHWNIDLELPEDGKEYEALCSFMYSYVCDLRHYSAAKYTSNTESFHHLANKYCSKGVRRCFNTHIARKTLAVLDWNENYKCQHHTYNFSLIIMRNFISSLK